MTDAAFRTGEEAVARRNYSSRGCGARAVETFLAISLLLAPAGGRAAPVGSPGAADPLGTLQVGHWIRIEGAVQADSTASCDELRILTGDFLDDDWGIRGFVAAIDSTRHEIVIGGVRVLVTDGTNLDGPPAFQTFSDLSWGSIVEVEGDYLKNRRLLAKEVDDESDDAWPRNQVRVVAKVEHLDARKRLVTVMGLVFQVSGKTRIRSAIE